MIVDGQYIEYDERSAANLQTVINKNVELKGDLKSEIEKPKEVLDDDNLGSAYGFSYNSLLGLEGDVTSGERKARYDIYREMDTMEFIHRALEVISDDATLENNEGNVIRILSDTEDIKNDLEDLFLHRLDMNNELWNIVYDTAKLGDNFFEVVPDNYKKPSKIVYLKYLEPSKVERVEKDGKLSHFEYYPDEKEKEKRSKDKTDEKMIYKLQPWQIIHFKVQVDRETDPYGGSLLKSGIRTYRRLSLLEDVVLVYRVSRAPERRVFRIDVGNLNSTEARKYIQKIKEQYRTQNFLDEKGNINKKANMLSVTSDIFVPVREGTQGTQIETLQGGEALKTIEDLDYFKDKILRTMNVPSSYLGDDADRSRGCIIGDTKIKLADGRDLSIKEITKEFENGKNNFIYSINEETLEWEIKPISWAGITGTNKKVIKIILDNNKEIICTPDHKFMLRNGEYIEAKDLKESDSLMPLYSKNSSREDRELNGYEMLLDNSTMEWKYTHRIAKKDELKKETKKRTVHHIDFNKRNNNPNNLLLMEWQEHFKYHQDLVSNGRFKEKNHPQYRHDLTIENIMSVYKEGDTLKNVAKKLNSERHVISKRLKKYGYSIEELFNNKKTIIDIEKAIKLYNQGYTRTEIAEKMNICKDTLARNIKDAGYLSWIDFIQQNNGGYEYPWKKDISTKEIIECCKNRITLKNTAKIFNVGAQLIKNRIKELGYKSWEDLKNQINHKVKEVISLDETYTVYDLTIDEETPNFALSSGIVIHNSLSNLDIKTAKFVERIQAQIVKGINKVAALELFFQGKKKEDLKDFKIELTPPSNIKEITEIDLISQRMNLIATIQGVNLYSNEWILKNVMKHTDREISDIKMQKSLEAKLNPQQGEEGAGGFGAEAGFGGAEAGGVEVPGAEAGAPAPEVPAPAPEAGLAASTIVNMFGKEFIVENKDDFFKIAKAAEEYLKEENRVSNNPVLEAVSDLYNKPLRRETVETTTDTVKRLFALNELGGLVFDNGSRKFKLFEKTKEGKEKEFLLG